MDPSHGNNDEADAARFLEAWFAVRQIIQAANFNRFHQAGLSATQFMILNLLPLDDGSLTMGELARRMNLKAGTVAKTVDSLEGRKLLTRTKNAADRRQVMVTITEEGRRFQNAAAGNFRQHITELFGSMPIADRAALIRGLESLVRVAGVPANPVDHHAEVPAGRNAPRSAPR